jgi:hypothetical protein
MDGSAFDHLVRTKSMAGTRRHLLGLVRGLPLMGLLAGAKAESETVAQ